MVTVVLKSYSSRASITMHYSINWCTRGAGISVTNAEICIDSVPLGVPVTLMCVIYMRALVT